MARTFVRQTQISGSFLPSDTLNFASRQSAVSSSSDLQADLNILRSVVKENFGTPEYIASVTPYNLKALGEKVDFIMTSSARFTGSVSMVNLDVDGTGSFGGNVSVIGTLSASSNIQGGGDLTIVGDVSANDGTFTGAVSANTLTASVGIDAVSGSFEQIKIDSDVATRLYIVGSNGEIKDEQKLTFDGSLLVVSGSATLTEDLNANDGTFSGNLIVTGDLTVNGTTTYINTENLIVEDNKIVIASGSAWIGPEAGVVLGNDVSPIASLLYNSSSLSWSLSHDLTVVGDVGAVSGTFSSDLTVTGLSDLNNVLASEIKIDSDVATRLYIVGSNGEIKDEEKLLYVSDTLKVTGSVEASTGSFNLVSSPLDLKFDDQHMSNGILLADASNTALSSSTYSGATSIIGAFNKVSLRLDQIGAGHQKEVIAVTSSVDTLAMSLTAPSDLQDDLNVYLNGVLLHASGTAANKAGVEALGVDAALNGSSIVFAFDLKNGDVVTFEKF